jgi:hypothetical protein
MLRLWTERQSRINEGIGVFNGIGIFAEVGVT